MSSSRKSRGKAALSYRRSRDELITKLGGVCYNCGFSDSRALQVDHKNGGGIIELRATSWRDFHVRVAADTTGKYQLLCANCNWIKRFEQGEHPSRSYTNKIR